MIICYMGGTCGDLISALIDPTDAIMNGCKLSLSVDRQRLKKPHLFSNDADKDVYLEQVLTKYKSIPSHDLDYHVRKKHEFIGIIVETFDTAMWAATRFKDMHREHVWQEMQKSCGADTIEKYAQMTIDYGNMMLQYTQRTITLESIRHGTAIDRLAEYIDEPIDQTLYHTWLTAQDNLRVTD